MRKKNNITKRKDLYIMDLNEKQKSVVEIYVQRRTISKQFTRKQINNLVEKKQNCQSHNG